MARSSTAAGFGCLILFCLPFAGVGVGTGGYLAWMIWQSMEIGRWQEVPARIVSADLETHSDSDGSSYRTVAVYEYEYEGTTYTGDRVGLAGGSDSVGSWQHRVHEELSEHVSSGEPFPCHVNPDDPSRAILYPTVRLELAAFLLLFALVFGGAGFGMLIFAVLGTRKEKERKVAEEVHPEEAWRWRKDWAAGRIVCSRRATLTMAVVMAFFWNLISAPVLFFVPEEVRDGNHLALIALVFPLVGAGFVLWAIYEILRWLKYGESYLELQTMPGVVGGRLEGIVQVRRHLEPTDGFEIRLACIRRVVSGSGKNRSTAEKLLWEERQLLARELEAHDITRTALPVSFQIPFDCEETDKDESAKQVVWRLEVEADVPGVDFAASFEVPVFRTAESSREPPPAPDLAEGFRIEVDAGEELAEGRIHVSERIGGGIEVRFPPARNVFANSIFTLFTAGWLGAAWLMLEHDAPLLFPIIFGLFGVLMVLGVFTVWFGSWQIEVHRGGITIERRYLGLGPTRVVPADEIDEITAQVRTQSGSTTWYDVGVVTASGRRRVAGTGIRGKEAADHLVARMQMALQAR